MNLDTPIQFLKGVGPKLAPKLNKLGIRTAEDLISYYPRAWQDFSKLQPIANLRLGETVVIKGKIISINNNRTHRKRMNIVSAIVEDEAGDLIKLVWFNQPFLINNFHVGDQWFFYGRVEYNWQQKEKTIHSPIYEKNSQILPIYAETQGLTSKYLRRLIKNLLTSLSIPDFLPVNVINNEKLLSHEDAIKEVHFPTNNDLLARAKYRLAFNEIFLIVLKMRLSKLEIQNQGAPEININKDLLVKFTKSLPYQLTNAQRKASWEIIQDMNRSYPMNRLLNGDVGSGKTIVALMAALNCVNGSHQVAWMAPTEILANQHYETTCKLLKDFGVKISLVTSNKVVSNMDGITNNQDTITKQIPNSKPKIQNKTKIENHSLENTRDKKSKIINSDIVIGTHAIIQEGISFPNLGLVIVDEQHRFGVSQRATLAGRRLTQTETQTNAKDEFLYKELSFEIRKCIFKVKTVLGLGQKENIYRKALEEEFKINKISFEKEKSVDILYNNKKIGVYRPDFVIDNKIILELKSLPFIGKIENRQVWQYLKGSKYKIAILVNFGGNDLEIQRIVYDNLRQSETSLSKSAKSVPHFLSMTATPIPRTLALSIYGDLDISVLDEMPAGRKSIITRLVDPTNRQKAYNFVNDQVKLGKQVFVICPLIEEKTKNQKPKTKPLDLARGRQTSNSKFQIQNLFDIERKSVKAEYERLSKQIFPELIIGILHGKLKSQEKEEVMQKFVNNKINILVSTSVVEVGVDIPNATVMMIEDADRFGLAQLHQFRGRVGRGEHQSYCLLFSNSLSPETNNRLKVLVDCSDGFKLAQKDLEIRGPGELVGVNQSGLPDLKMASLTDIIIINQARQAVNDIIKVGINKFPLLKAKLIEFITIKHFE